MKNCQSIWCHSALLRQGWAENVLIRFDDRGQIVSIETGVAAGETDRPMEKLTGTIIAGIPNLHSHAHQRAMAGLGERASGDSDSFWTWRKVMYHFLARINPDQLYHIARMLYLEMLQAGYTRVGEFQYLHHDQSGNPYANRAEMTLQCHQAAHDVGIGFTALPVLYRYSGFGSKPPAEEQKRFINDADGFLEILTCLQQGMDSRDRIGIAPHSLRAIDEPLLQEVLDQTPANWKVHIHIAEQTREVDDCVQWSDQTPLTWLYQRFSPDQNWCLIHATHMSPEETKLLATSGAIAGLCPTTEANLGDGFFNAEQFFSAEGNWGIGSDSQISVSPVEELRWLEYGQRLGTRGRNVLAGEFGESMHTGRNLYSRAALGGALACDGNGGELAVGKQADFILLDDNHPRLYGRSGDNLLNSWIFSGNDNMVSDVFVAGKQVINVNRHKDQDEIRTRFQQTMDQLAD